MKKTQIKIIQTSIALFNQHGVGNVRVVDIAREADISPGNLTYYYKTKKELMGGLYAFMKIAFKKVTEQATEFLEEKLDSTIDITRAYLKFQVQFRFFYRDNLEVFRLFPEAPKVYQKHYQQVIQFNKDVIQLMLSKGLLKSNVEQEHYDILAKNSWAVLNSWLSETEILETGITEGIVNQLELYYPYFTPEGATMYHRLRKHIEAYI